MDDRGAKRPITSATYYEHTGLGCPVRPVYCYRVFGVNVVGTSTSFVGFGDAYATTYECRRSGNDLPDHGSGNADER